jgi:hypothetical protein
MGNMLRFPAAARRTALAGKKRPPQPERQGGRVASASLGQTDAGIMVLIRGRGQAVRGVGLR